VSHPLADHLDRPRGRGHTPDYAVTGAAGGAACGDLIRISVACADGVRVTDAGFDASGCGAAIAAGSAAVGLVRDRPLLDAARIRAHHLAAELGGLIPGKMHAAELAADALHRALGAAARARGALRVAQGRTLVAMSGGVDSAVAALLTARSGGDVVAVTLELWADPENDGESSCCSASAVRGARALAHQLGLPHFSLDLREEFRTGVVDPWLADHAAGLTPNPCVRCNGSVRLDAMLEFAECLGASGLATGHYARVVDEPAGPLLRAAADPAKDQTYMLAGLSRESLARMRFPLGDLVKGRVRELAAEAGLPVANKPDSQDLCFLAGTGRSAFLARHGGRREREGSIVDCGGRELGRHRGHEGYTVGQRRGLGLGGGDPLYVLATDARTNTVTVGQREELATRLIALRDVTLHRRGAEVDQIKLRYRSPSVAGGLLRPASAGCHEALDVRLREPVAGAAPGQLATLMHGDLIVGHGTIASYTPDRR
jgi:tRNA-uridine 2-sulfurtransferase